jgi:hypothetical protein
MVVYNTATVYHTIYARMNKATELSKKHLLKIKVGSKVNKLRIIFVYLSFSFKEY